MIPVLMKNFISTNQLKDKRNDHEKIDNNATIEHHEFISTG